MKICVIGAGSPYTPELIEQFSKMKSYTGTTLPGIIWELTHWVHQHLEK